MDDLARSYVTVPDGVPSERPLRTDGMAFRAPMACDGGDSSDMLTNDYIAHLSPTARCGQRATGRRDDRTNRGSPPSGQRRLTCRECAASGSMGTAEALVPRWVRPYRWSSDVPGVMPRHCRRRFT
jgi:hypothetical protein